MLNSLLTEVIACLVAASLFSLFIGWMIKGALSREKLRVAEAKWEQKYSELEIRSRQNNESLEERLQSLEGEKKVLTDSHRAISETLRENETTVLRARAEAIELNRQQAETQERLQKILKEKDDEIAALSSQSRTDRNLGMAATAVGATASAKARVTQLHEDRANGNLSPGEFDDRLKVLTDKRDSLEQERKDFIDSTLEDQQTIAMEQTVVLANNEASGEQHDQTIRMSAADALSSKFGKSADKVSHDDTLDSTEETAFIDSTADATAILDDGIEMNEATVVLDDDALAYARSTNVRSIARKGGTEENKN